jgi:hypothetical protein
MKNTETKMSSPQKDSFRDRIATIDEKGKRKWIFAQKPKGKFYNIRSWVSWGFFALFFAIPFIKLNSRPLFLFNIPESEFIIFGKIFWPQDFVIFGLTMVTFIVFIVLFTAAFGRVFCGWVCPQNYFYGNAFQKSRIHDRWRCRQTKSIEKCTLDYSKKSGKDFSNMLLSFYCHLLSPIHFLLI